MADRYAFQSPFSRDSGSTPWFTIGSVGVTTTAAISGLAFAGLLLLAIERNFGPVGSALILNDSALFGGQIWRLFTWPVAVVDSQQIFGQFLSAVFFFSIGSQMESRLGRRSFTSLIAISTVIPAVLGAVVAPVSTAGVYASGLSVLFLGVAVGFAASAPHAKSFFGIPFWVLVAGILGISILQDLANGNMPMLVMHISASALGLTYMRSIGYAPDVAWAPSVPLPTALTGQSTTQTTRPSKRSRKKSAASSSHLRSVPTYAASEAEIDSLLDQVSEHGIDSLTKQQKQTLERHSQEMRKRRES